MSKVTRQTARHNSDMRDVCCLHSYRLSEFVEKASGNLLINGGFKNQRRQCLLEYIAYSSRTTDRPIVIFSDDDKLEEALINMAVNGQIGELNVCSEKYKKYDFFCGMPNRFISECLTRIATARGCRDTMDAQNYINAFLAIVEYYQKKNGNSNGPDLNSMLELAAKSDNKIKDLISNELISEIITSSAKGGVLLRSMLQVFAEETEAIRNVENVSISNASNCITIKNAINKGIIILVKTPTVNCEMFSVYFASELRSLIDKNFVCIFDDSFMLDTEVMQTVISMMKKMSHINVVISCDNIIAFDEVRNSSILVNFNCNLIFLNGYVPQQDMQKVLSGFGQYTHMEAMKNKTTPPSLFFTFEHGEGESAQSYTRDRILLQEVNDYEAIITYGGDSQIIIAEKLI